MTSLSDRKMLQKKTGVFFEQHRRVNQSSAREQLGAALQVCDLEQKYMGVRAALNEISDELVAQRFYGVKKFEITEKDVKCLEFMHRWEYFYRNRFQFAIWSDIAQAGLELLGRYLQGDQSDYYHLSGFEQFMSAYRAKILQFKTENQSLRLAKAFISIDSMQ